MAGSVLVTGSAGFIGSHVSKRLLEMGRKVVGVDNLNDYYDPRLKLDRLGWLEGNPDFLRVDGDVSDVHLVRELFDTYGVEEVVHLAAQAGVRYSLERPDKYIQSNLVGFGNVLEACRLTQVKHLVYASSSSVYGSNTAMPFSTSQNTDHPVSLYAATKKANEAMAHAYSHLYRLPTTGLRFFTVYGPWGRPDMAPMLFAKAIASGEPIQVFNHGNMKRDFTYIDDIVQGVVRTLAQPAEPLAGFDSAHPAPQGSSAPYRLYNIGNSQPVQLLRFIEVLEQAFGREAKKVFLPMQPGDVVETYADVADLERAVGFAPTTSIEDGIEKFAAWYRDYFQVR